MEISSMNNLADIYKLYCKGPELQKQKRETFVSGCMEDVRQDFQALMSYCSQDVIATHKILSVLLPVFFER